MDVSFNVNAGNKPGSFGRAVFPALGFLKIAFYLCMCIDRNSCDTQVESKGQVLEPVFFFHHMVVGD